MWPRNWAQIEGLDCDEFHLYFEQILDVMSVGFGRDARYICMLIERCDATWRGLCKQALRGGFRVMIVILG